MAEPNNKSPL